MVDETFPTTSQASTMHGDYKIIFVLQQVVHALVTPKRLIFHSFTFVFPRGPRA